MTTLHRSFPVARRSHRCSSCGRGIAPGERYHRWKGVVRSIYDGVMTVKECADCMERYGRRAS